MSLLSLNNKFIVEPYLSDNQIKSAGGGGGFAMIQQKVSLKGLKLLVDAKIDGLGEWQSPDFETGVRTVPRIITKGSTVFIKEELLYTQPWAKKLYECDAIEGKFIIVDLRDVEFIDF